MTERRICGNKGTAAGKTFSRRIWMIAACSNGIEGIIALPTDIIGE
jgi:hypothetical protein